MSGSVPPRFITLIRDIRSREILYSRDERTAEAKAASPLPASVPKAKMSSAVKPAAKPRSRGQSPEPTDAQLSIPYFAECYQIQKDNQHKEKWTAGRICRDTELAMDVNKDEERNYYLRLCQHYGVEPIPDDSAYFRRHATRLGKPKVAGSSATASFLQAESDESAAGAASAPAPSKTREEKKSEDSQGSSLGPPGPPPGPPPKMSSVRKSTRAESAPARRTTGAEFLSEGRKEKRPLSADKGAKSGSADTGRIASTSGSSSADAGSVAGASGTSATVKSESQGAVARLRECLSEAASSGKLAKVLSENPKEAKGEDPTSEVKVEDPAAPLSLFAKLANAVAELSEQKPCLEDVVPSEMLEAEQARVERVADNPEDPGSEVDWGDESVKEEKEEPSSEEDGEKPIVPASDAGPAAVLGDSPAGAVDPLQDLTEEELKLVAIWAHRPMGYQRAVECLLLGAHKLLEKEAATKEGERAALEKSISRVLNRLVAGEFSLEEEAELERLETSQTKLAIQARAMRLHSLRRLLDHAATAGSVLEARLRSTGASSEAVEAFDKAEACRQAEDQARDAVFRRQLNEIQLGQSSRTIPQIVREARKRLRAKKHRLQLSAKLNQEISTALREKILDGSRDVRLAAGSTWKVEDNLDELDYPPGTWWCRRCQGTSRGTGDCQGYLRGQRCSGSFASTFHSWARTAVGAELLRAASGKRRSERVRQEIAPSLKGAGWTCNRCEAENLALKG